MRSRILLTSNVTWSHEGLFLNHDPVDLEIAIHSPASGNQWSITELMSEQKPYQQPQQPYQAPPYQGPPPKSGGSSTMLIVGLILGGIALLSMCICPIGIALLLPAVQAAREAARQTTSANHLKQMGLGIYNYHDVYKRLPRAAMPDADGKPMHSWRTAILPFTEQPQLYDRVDFNKAWNEPPNSSLNSIELPYGQSPNDTMPTSTDTSYLAIVGPEAAFDPDRQLSLADIVDGTSNTIAVIEVHNTGINWMEPRDITIEEAITYISSSSRPVNALMMDGSVQRVSPDVPPEKLRAMMTREGRDGSF